MAEIAAGQATIEDLQKQVRQQQLTLTTKDLELENEKARADLAETVVTTTQGRAAEEETWASQPHIDDICHVLVVMVRSILIISCLLDKSTRTLLRQGKKGE